METGVKTIEPARKRNPEIEEEKRQKEEEKKRLMEQMKQERKDEEAEFQVNPIQDSKDNKIGFEAKMATSKDLNLKIKDREFMGMKVSSCVTKQSLLLGNSNLEEISFPREPISYFARLNGIEECILRIASEDQLKYFCNGFKGIDVSIETLKQMLVTCIKLVDSDLKNLEILKRITILGNSSLLRLIELGETIPSLVEFKELRYQVWEDLSNSKGQISLKNKLKIILLLEQFQAFSNHDSDIISRTHIQNAIRNMILFSTLGSKVNQISLEEFHYLSNLLALAVIFNHDYVRIIRTLQNQQLHSIRKRVSELLQENIFNLPTVVKAAVDILLHLRNFDLDVHNELVSKTLADQVQNFTYINFAPTQIDFILENAFRYPAIIHDHEFKINEAILNTQPLQETVPFNLFFENQIPIPEIEIVDSFEKMNTTVEFFISEKYLVGIKDDNRLILYKGKFLDSRHHTLYKTGNRRITHQIQGKRMVTRNEKSVFTGEENEQEELIEVSQKKKTMTIALPLARQRIKVRNLRSKKILLKTKLMSRCPASMLIKTTFGYLIVEKNLVQLYFLKTKKIAIINSKSPITSAIAKGNHIYLFINKGILIYSLDIEQSNTTFEKIIHLPFLLQKSYRSAVISSGKALIVMSTQTGHERFLSADLETNQITVQHRPAQKILFLPTRSLVLALEETEELFNQPSIKIPTPKGLMLFHL